MRAVLLASRNDLATVTDCQWRLRSRNRYDSIRWCSVQTDRTGDRWFPLLGVGPEIYNRQRPEAFLASDRGCKWRVAALGQPVPLGNLHTVPENDNLLACIEPGVKWSLGVQNDGLLAVCGRLAYAYCTGVEGQPIPLLTDEDRQRESVVGAALTLWLTRGRAEAIRTLKESGVFRPKDVFAWNGGPAAHDPRLIEWDHQGGSP